MFILRWISMAFAILGFIIFGTIVYFSFSPLKKTLASTPTISTILNCNESKVVENVRKLDDNTIKSLKDQFGTKLPAVVIRDFSNTMDTVVSAFGTQTQITVTYCTTEDKEALQRIKKYFEENKNYNSGSIDNLISGLNQIPAINISNFSLSVQSVVARTSYCITPINRMSILLYSFIESPTYSNENLVVLFDIKFIEESEAKAFEKIISNLLITGQYFKSSLRCNE